MKKQRLKLYVWTDFEPDWTSGLAFAIATSEADARKQILKAIKGSLINASTVYNWGTLEILPLTKKFATFVYGGG